MEIAPFMCYVGYAVYGVRLLPEPMLKVGAAEAQRNFGLYQDKALIQPVAIARNGRPRAVMISIEEYERLKRRDRQVFRTEEAPQDVVDAKGRPKPVTLGQVCARDRECAAERDRGHWLVCEKHHGLDAGE